MDFIGRKTEFAELEEHYQRPSGFVVISGRRRVGKTTLIKEFIKNKSALYFVATLIWWLAGRHGCRGDPNFA